MTLKERCDAESRMFLSGRPSTLTHDNGPVTARIGDPELSSLLYSHLRQREVDIEELKHRLKQAGMDTSLTSETGVPA